MIPRLVRDGAGFLSFAASRVLDLVFGPDTAVPVKSCNEATTSGAKCRVRSILIAAGYDEIDAEEIADLGASVDDAAWLARLATTEVVA